jgi:hypothetical protein
MKSVLPLHLVSVGLWLGCVLTEALFERALLGKGRDAEAILASLHKRVDLFVEIPAFVAVVITGAFMLPSAALTPAFIAKVGFGFVAVLANAYCVWLVFRRHAFSSAGDWASFARADQLQHKIGGVVLVCLLVAFGIGIVLPPQ